MLFFVLFAICFTQTTAKTCYAEYKNSAGKVVGYVKSEAEACVAPLTDKEPKIEGLTYGCVNTLESCDNKNNVQQALCGAHDYCIEATDSSSFKITINGGKMKAEIYNDNNKCTGTPQNAELDCGKCQAESDGAVEFKCGNMPEEKKKFCYFDEKDGDNVIAYIKTPQVAGVCIAGEVKDKAPEIKGDVVCTNIGEAEANKCSVTDDNLVMGICMDTDYCLPVDSKSYAYDVSGDDIYLYEYSSKDCKGEPKKYKGKCGECAAEEGVAVQFTCGAFETAILLAIAFLFFLF